MSFFKFSKLFAYSLSLSFALPCCNFLGTDFNVCAMESGSDSELEDTPYVFYNSDNKMLYFDVSAEEISNNVKNSFKIHNLNDDGLSYTCPICLGNKNFEFATICKNCKNMFCMNCYMAWSRLSNNCPLRCEDSRQNICYIVSVEKPILKLLSGNHFTNFTLNSIDISKILHLSDYYKLRDEIISKSKGLKHLGIYFDEIEVIVDSPTDKSIVKLLQKGNAIAKFDGKENVSGIVNEFCLENKVEDLVNTIYKYVYAIIVGPDYYDYDE